MKQEPKVTSDNLTQGGVKPRPNTLANTLAEWAKRPKFFEDQV